MVHVMFKISSTGLEGRSLLAGDFPSLNRLQAGDKNRCSSNLEPAVEYVLLQKHPV